ncbi:MAG: PGPGW domain-containing protein [Acidimicrobiia bacterium]
MQDTSSSLGRRAVVSVAGTSLIVVGTAGLFFPVVPGVVLIASGLGILGKQYGWARTTLDRVTPARLRRRPETTEGSEAA